MTLGGESLLGNPEAELAGSDLSTLLLPAFDEYVIPYKDKSLVLNEGQHLRSISRNGMFFPLIIQNGKLIGIWKRNIKKEAVKIEITPLGKVGEIANSAQAYGQFLGKIVELP
jgi:hypothetical protein